LRGWINAGVEGLMKLELSRQIFKKGLMEILPMGVELLCAEGQNDRCEEANSGLS
jgi:hypothetical protein